MHARWNKSLPPLAKKGTASKVTSPSAQLLVSPLVSYLDPYYRWAEATDCRGFAEQTRWNREEPAERKWQVQVRANSPAHLQELLNQPDWRHIVQKSYLHSGEAIAIRRQALWFTALPTKDAVATLARTQGAPRWKLAMPLRDAQSAAMASPKGYYGIDRDLAAMRAVNEVAAAVRAAKKHGPDHPRLLTGAIAVIDFGCPFLHNQFKSADGTRVRALWDQGSAAAAPKRTKRDKADPKLSWPWHKPKDFSYGREMGPRTLDAIAKASRESGSPDEATVYRGIDHLIAYADPRRRVWMATHGGHVMDVAGGKPDPLHKHGDDDPACSAPLVFVQLPSLTAADSAGGSLGAHVLDGVRYAMAQVPEDKPLVVVLSYGNCAGPHDGTAPIEEALDELLRERPGNFAIVLAAGNARNDRGHARRTVRKDRSVMLRLAVAAGDTTDTFVEVWYPEGGPALQMRVRSPEKVWSDWVARGEDALMRATNADGDVVAMVRHDRSVPNGHGALALLALAPTALPPGLACSTALPGLWEIELRLDPDHSDAVAEVPINAWIERDDPVQGSPGSRTHFQDQEDSDEQDTFSGIATGRSTIKACGFNWASGQPAPYSSLPRHGQPDDLTVLVVCEEDTYNPSIAAAATRSSEVYRMNGTSVAAPLLARHLYVKMCEGPIQRDGWRAVLKALCTKEGVVRTFSTD